MSFRTREPWQGLVCGGMGSVCADFSCMPLDVIKVRLQLGNSGLLGDERYRGAVDCAKKIVRTQGVRGLYRGLPPAILRAGTYGTTRIAMYDPLKTWIAGDVPRSQIGLQHAMFAGAGSGAVSSFMFNPCDVLKIRMQGDPATYTRVLPSIRLILKEEGFAALYNGASPSVTRAIVCACAELITYDYAKRALMLSMVWPWEDALPTHVTASFGAALLSTISSQPLDLVKSRMMLQTKGGTNTVMYSGLLDCLVKSVQKEGVRGLYQGFWPSLSRVGPHTTYVRAACIRCHANHHPS